MADIPTENTYQSIAVMPGANDILENGENLPYVSNCVIDRDMVETPKEEFLDFYETPDFFEFDRVFKCSRPEFIYLIRGISYEKQFSIAIVGDNHARSYRLINIRCTDTVRKQKTKSDKSKTHEKCCFFLQYIEEPDNPDVYRLHAHERRHKHPLDAEIPIDMTDYF